MTKRIKNLANNPPLNPRDITMIAKMVEQMDSRLRPTWPKIIQVAKTVTKLEYSRQALSAHLEIATAYESVSNEHKAFKANGRVRKPQLPDDEEKSQKIASLAVKVEQQSELIVAYQDLLVRFIGNAMLSGITQERLEASLEPRAEWRTDLDEMADRTKEARRKQRRSDNAGRP